MRYIKVLVLAVFIFLALVFFFQNQIALSQQLELNLNLFFIPPMKSIPLPFYFIVVASFFVGCILALAFLLWDKFNISARLLKSKWRISSLEREVAKLKRQIADDNQKLDAMQSVNSAGALPPGENSQASQAEAEPAKA